MEDPRLQFVRSLTWDDVLRFWRVNEDTPDSHWESHWKEEGYASWDQWRADTHAHLHGEQLQWGLYRITDALSVIPQFRGGPFRSWIERFYHRLGATPTFEQLAGLPRIYHNTFIQGLLRNFPEETVITAVGTPDGIIVVEGMHRCCAIALKSRWSQPGPRTVFLALAEIPGRLPALGAVHS